MNKKMIALAATGALVALLALAGCGGSQASSSAASSSAAASSAVSESASAAASSASAAASSASAAANSASAPAASSAATSSASYIGDTAAKEIALKDAGVAEADCTKLEIELDLDDAVVHYDVDFKAGGMEYDYDIDANTGAIIQAKSEVDD